MGGTLGGVQQCVRKKTLQGQKRKAVPGVLAPPISGSELEEKRGKQPNPYPVADVFDCGCIFLSNTF